MKKKTHGGRRKGSGRKPKYHEPAQRVTTKIPCSIVRKLDKRADATGRSRSELIVESVRKDYG